MFSVVIPVYNSSLSLEELVLKIAQIFQEKIKESYEIILVEDGSQNQKTWETIEEITKKNKNIKAIKLTRNFGQHPATLCGFKEAKGDYIITMDDDLQHDPIFIPELLKKKNHDIVIANFHNKKHGFLKRVSSSVKGYFDYLLVGKPKHIKLSSFRLIKKEVAEQMLLVITPYPIISALMFYVTRDVANVSLEHNTRVENKSSYTFLKSYKLFKALLINNSSILLNVIGKCGIIIAFISVCVTLYLFVSSFTLDRLAGWTSIMLSIFFFGGLIMFSLGVIGEYLLRIISTVEKKPTFLIKKIISSDEK